ncbi:hypothetical protein TNCV_4800361 [Trichonephila clavipes]|nr:hypothetical protein TNCV_4800361 [Trichonephila clavipes]
MSTKRREIKPSKRKIKKPKSSGRNANKTSDSDENQALAKEKNDLLRQIDFLNSIILDTKLKEPNKDFFSIAVSSNDELLPEKQHLCEVCLQHFGFSFAVVSSFLGWPTVKLKALLQAPLASPSEGNVPDGGKERRRNIRTRQNPFGPQERQTRIDKAVITLKK